METPFRLEALSLRGFGPYYDTARLELRPITVICGKNGSGKSTWFRAVDLIRRSLERRDFPFAWEASTVHWASDIEVTNARLYLNGFSATSEGSKDGLPPGTISLDIVSTGNVAIKLPHHREAEGNAAELFLWSGIIPRGTKISLWFSHPQIAGDDELTQFRDEVRLIIDGKYHLWFHRPLGQSGGYQLECSGAFRPGGVFDDLVLAPVCSFDPRDLQPATSEDDWKRRVCQNAVSLIRHLAKSATDGFFHLAAIRPLQQSQDAAAVRFEESAETHRGRIDAEQQAGNTRNVGDDGGQSLSLFREFAYNRMIRTHAPGEDASSTAAKKGDDGSTIGYVFEGFVSQWLDKLLSIRVGQYSGARGPKSQVLDSIHEVAGLQPLGHLETSVPHPVQAVLSTSGELDGDVSSAPSALAVFAHRCFGWEQQPPARFSAGFHQVFPIVVQVGLMQRIEVLFLENPEVHLHPSLQVDLTEFLLKQAGEGQGRTIVIETQSDLVIRRVLRAMIEEDARFPERIARIYFCDLERVDDDFDQAKIEPLALDSRGRVNNWPEGFLDTSVAESGRLLRAMYGELPQEEDDI